jgi:hypothetical protein
MNGVVQALQRRGNRLFVGGAFNKVGGVNHGGIATLNATTGALDPFMNSNASVNHNWTTGSRGAKGPIMIRALDITPDGSRLIALGNFKKIDGLDRDQAVMFDLTGTTAVVKSNWRTRSFEAACVSGAFDSWVRDVQFSPDGSYFAVVTTGGPGGTNLCDSASRFETAAVGDAITPTWVNYTGGDSMYAVSVTGTAIYVGGHMRWLNNPSGHDNAGAGAVARPGIGALDPLTGVPLKWNPGRNPRGVGVQALYSTSTGLWMGSDTDYVGNRLYKRQRIAFFPLTGSVLPPARQTAKLPGNVYLGATTASPKGLAKRSYDGTTVGALTTVASTLDWSTVRGITEIDGSLIYGKTDGWLYRRTFDGTTFGTETKVNPYSDPLWDTVKTGTSVSVFNGIPSSFYGELNNLTSMAYEPSTSRMYYTISGSVGLYYRPFSPESGITGPTRMLTAGPIMPAAVSGAFVAGSNFYYVNASTGNLYRATLTNGVPGAGTLVSGPANGGVDWRARAVFLDK